MAIELNSVAGQLHLGGSKQSGSVHLLAVDRDVFKSDVRVLFDDKSSCPDAGGSTPGSTRAVLNPGNHLISLLVVI